MKKNISYISSVAVLERMNSTAFPPKLFFCWILHTLSQKAQAYNWILVLGTFLFILSLSLKYLTFLLFPQSLSWLTPSSPYAWTIAIGF